MEIYSTEEQQIEAIKRFLRENGLSIVAGVVLGLAGLYGFQYYQQAKVTAAEAKSDSYTTLVEKLTAETKDNAAWDQDVQAFLTANTDSAYANLAALLAAKEAVLAKDFAKAEQQLSWAFQHSQQAEVKAVAQLRLARVQAEQSKYTEALTTLQTDVPAAFKAQQLELKGDVLLASGDAVGAKAAYSAAKQDSAATQNPLLDIKLNELAHVAG